MINPVVHQQIAAKLGRILGFDSYFENPEQVMISECAEGILFREGASYLPEGWVAEITVFGDLVSGDRGRVRIGSADEWLMEASFEAVEMGSGEFAPQITVVGATLIGQGAIRRFGYVQDLAIELAELLSQVANGAFDQEGLDHAAEWLEARRPAIT